LQPRTPRLIRIF